MFYLSAKRFIEMVNLRSILKSVISKFFMISLFFLFSIPLSSAQTELPLDEQQNNFISINFYQTDVAIILQALADNKQLNLVLDDDVSIKQTIKLQNIDWQKALDIVLHSAKLQAQIEDNILFVSKAIDPQILLERQQQELKEQQLKQPLEIMSIAVNHAQPMTLIEAIEQQELLSPRGKAVIDKRTNSLIITDITERFEGIKKLVKAFDKPVSQVHISAHIVTMSEESMNELGIKWGYSGGSSLGLNKFDVGLDVASATSTVGFNLAKLSSGLLNLELSALEAENQLEIIASPNLLTANQNTASIKQGTDIPYEVSSGSNGATSIEFKQAVLGLEVTPKIIADDKMILDLFITQNTAGQSIKRRDGGEALAIETQEIKTQVMVKSGETVVLGGIFQQINNSHTRKVPGVSKLPIIGNLFNNKSKKQQKRELVIFITPQLVE